MSEVVASDVGHLVAMVALGILVVIETVCLPSTLMLLCLFREGRMTMLHRQESLRVGATGSTILGCLFVLVYMPTCMVLLGWHATLDNHPIACMCLSLLDITLSVCALCNMFYMSMLSLFTVIRPLHVDAIFTRRRGLVSYVITVYVIPLAIATTLTALILTTVEEFYEEHVVCLAFPVYWPQWILQGTTCGILIPVTAATFILNSNLAYITNKQANRTGNDQPIRLQPAPGIHVINEHVPADTIVSEVTDMPRRHGSRRSRRWKGGRLMYMNICVAIFFLIPTYSVASTVSFCRDCFPPETAFVTLLTASSLTTLVPIFYNYSNARVREIIKKDISHCFNGPVCTPEQV